MAFYLSKPVNQTAAAELLPVPLVFIASIKHYGQQAFCSTFTAAAESSFCASAWLSNIPLLLLYPDFKHIITLLTGLHIAALYSKAL